MSTTLEERLRYIKNEKIEKIIPNNIKAGVTILNVTGSVIESNEEPTITVDPSTQVINIEPSAGYTGIRNVVINGVNSNICSNITSENIRSNVEILGIVGNLEEIILDNEFNTQENLLNIQVSDIQNIYDILNNKIISSIQEGTADGNITSNDVMAGKIGYANGQRIVGTRSENFIVQNGMKFAYSTNLANNLDFSQVINADRLFDSVTDNNLQNIVSNMNTGNMNTMFRMFSNYNLTSALDLSNFNTINLKNACCVVAIDNPSYSNLQSIDISNWNTSKLLYMGAMFGNQQKLSNIYGLNDLDTSNVVEMYRVFWGCKNISELNLGNWNTTNVVNLFGLFENCSNLVNINGLENWNVSKATRVYNMFINCNNLTTINISNWNLSGTSDVTNMFFACNNLSNASVDSIINMCINATNVRYKNLATRNSYSPFFGTNISNARYANRWSDLTNAGWSF